MSTRAVCILLAAVAAGLISCSKAEKSTKEVAVEKPAAPEKGGEASVADTTLADKYFVQAQQFAKESKHDSAVVYFEKAGALFKAEENWEKYVRCYNRIGSLFSRRGDFNAIMKYTNQVLETALQKLGEQHLEVAASYNNLGNAYNFAGKYDEALKLYNQALRIRLSLQGEQHPEVAKVYGNIGTIYLSKGDYDQTITFYNKSLAIMIATQGEKHPDVGVTYGNIGFIYWTKGDYDKALSYYQQGLHIMVPILGEKAPILAYTYNNMGLVYWSKGDYDKAIDFFNKALPIYSSTLGEQHADVAGVYNNLGNVYAQKGAYQQAIAFYKKALSIRLAIFGMQHPDVAESYHNIGSAYADSREYSQALNFHQKALSIKVATLGELHPQTAESYNNIGGIYTLKGDFDQAIVSYQNALRANTRNFDNTDQSGLPFFDNVLSAPQLLESLKGKAMALANRYAKQSHHLGDLETAVSNYQLASQLIDQIRNSYKVEGSKLFLVEKATDIYDQAIQTALQLHRVTQRQEPKQAAFLFAEKSKAGIMLAALSETEAKQFAGIPDSLLAKEKQLRIDLSFYEKSLTEEQSRQPKVDSTKLALLQGKAFDLKQAYEALLQEFEKEYPDYYNLKYQIKTVSVPEVQQQLLDDRTALVEYFTGKDSIFIFAITKDELTIKTSAKDSLLARQIEQLRQGITQQDFSAYAPPAHRLYQILLEPVADKIHDKHLSIVPDGAMNAIPFDALLAKPVEAKGNGQNYAELPYVVNEHVVSYAYSATLLQQEQSRKNREAKHDYLALAPVFANGLPAGTRSVDFIKENLRSDSLLTATRVRGYLPATKKEVTGILSRFEDSYSFLDCWFGNKSRVYLEREAKEEKLKSRDLSDYRFLHFATHGLVNEKSPKLSGLLLAQEDTTSKEDGILYLGEIYNLNLNADLVVLSACETGLGQIAKGEGIMGLARGFLYAGASNLLVSLWQVSDVTTSDLMMDFYDKMLGGMSKPEALREAKLQMIRRHPEYAKPYYWAPFILIGK